MGPPPSPGAPRRAWHCPASPGIISELVGGSSLDKNEKKKKIPAVASSILLFGFRSMSNFLQRFLKLFHCWPSLITIPKSLDFGLGHATCPELFYVCVSMLQGAEAEMSPALLWGAWPSPLNPPALEEITVLVPQILGCCGVRGRDCRDYYTLIPQPQGPAAVSWTRCPGEFRSVSVTFPSSRAEVVGAQETSRDSPGRNKMRVQTSLELQEEQPTCASTHLSPTVPRQEPLSGSGSGGGPAQPKVDTEMCLRDRCKKSENTLKMSKNSVRVPAWARNFGLFGIVFFCLCRIFCLRLETSLDFVILKLMSLLSHGCPWHRTAQIPLLVRRAQRISSGKVSCVTGKAIESLKSSAASSISIMSFHYPKVGNSSLFNKAFSMCQRHEAGAYAVPKGPLGFWGPLTLAPSANISDHPKVFKQRKTNWP